ncbi:MAG: nucleotide exchange factor GrpE [Thermoguttaceae bacterium]|jgi:molecular chaperone GrpE|nr:nucleotide exchange factor GrpE [Thermoguttaceae bacterium]
MAHDEPNQATPPEAGPASGPNGQPQPPAEPQTGEVPAEAGSTAVQDQAAEIDRLRSELAQARDRALRSLAELDNYRKRADRMVEEERRYACLPLLRDLLPVLDNVKRAIEAVEKIPEATSLREGVELVARQLEGVLAKHHCNPIAALHQPFDPNYHEALLQQPSAEFPPNTVLQEVRTGFMLHDRVVRPSQVIVSAPP